MRKITETAVENFYNNTPFTSGNTKVVVEDKEYLTGSGSTTKVSTTYLVLHGHKIAYTNSYETSIRTCGYNTNTTKERLRGVLNELDIKLYTKKGVMYLEYSCCDEKYILENNDNWNIVTTA